MSATLEEIIEKISDRYDADEIVEILCISSEDLLQAFAQDFLDNLHKFEYSAEIEQAYSNQGGE